MRVPPRPARAGPGARPLQWRGRGGKKTALPVGGGAAAGRAGGGKAP